MQRRQVVREPDAVVERVVAEQCAPLRLDGVNVRARRAASDLAAEGRERFWAAKGCMGGPRRQKSSLDSLGIQVGTLNLIKISGVVCTYNPHSLQP